MPFYEGIGLIAEKNAVVIDIGSAYTKVGTFHIRSLKFQFQPALY